MNGLPVVRPYTPSAANTPSLQLASLATATCLMRTGAISRDQAVALMQQQGESWGWSTNWGQRIPLHRVDQAISAGGGCTALIQRIRESGQGSTAVFPATYSNPGSANPGNGYQGMGGSRSEQEGFGLAPYR